jgi:transcriptional regulator with XRE-family HTH domain
MKYQSETFDAKKAYEVWKKSGRTQAWLAAQLGVGPEHVSKVLNGKSNPSYAVLKLLAAALETRLEDLMADSSAA